jgi:hypothetical protein
VACARRQIRSEMIATLCTNHRWSTPDRCMSKVAPLDGFGRTEDDLPGAVLNWSLRRTCCWSTSTTAQHSKPAAGWSTGEGVGGLDAHATYASRWAISAARCDVTISFDTLTISKIDRSFSKSSSQIDRSPDWCEDPPIRTRGCTLFVLRSRYRTKQLLQRTSVGFVDWPFDEDGGDDDDSGRSDNLAEQLMSRIWRSEKTEQILLHQNRAIIGAQRVVAMSADLTRLRINVFAAVFLLGLTLLLRASCADGKQMI